MNLSLHILILDVLSKPHNHLHHHHHYHIIKLASSLSLLTYLLSFLITYIAISLSHDHLHHQVLAPLDPNIPIMRKPDPMGKPASSEKMNNNVKFRKGLWSPEEDEKLMKYMVTNGQGCWSDIARNAGLQRCGKSCRLRWINYLRPDLKRGAFSPHEQQLIVHLHSMLGNRWSQIAARLPGRTDNEIKNFWNSTLKKRMKNNLAMSSSPNDNNSTDNSPDGRDHVTASDHDHVMLPHNIMSMSMRMESSNSSSASLKATMGATGNLFDPFSVLDGNISSGHQAVSGFTSTCFAQFGNNNITIDEGLFYGDIMDPCSGEIGLLERDISLPPLESSRGSYVNNNIDHDKINVGGANNADYYSIDMQGNSNHFSGSNNDSNNGDHEQIMIKAEDNNFMVGFGDHWGLGDTDFRMGEWDLEGLMDNGISLVPFLDFQVLP